MIKVIIHLKNSLF